MTPEQLTTAQFLEVILRMMNEIFFPGLALWIAYLVRKWVHGQLSPPPYEHKVTVVGDKK